MKFGVNKKVLLYTAGCVWIFAGINIFRIGIVTWLNDTHYWSLNGFSINIPNGSPGKTGNIARSLSST